MHYEITSTQDVSIDGIGLLEGGEPKKVSAEELRIFEKLNGVSLAKANFPDSIHLVFAVEEEVED